MDLRITSYGNFLKVKGVLNKRNFHLFERELNLILNRGNKIVVNVVGIEHIDRYGIKNLLELHRLAVMNKKDVSIIGSGPTRLYNKFKSETLV
ncbi:hypothetical protein [Aestuariivivens sediminis]|uniref:hypothetical protein n=1 Tax=Aestuariivivens sediminis TaxID=2913557 RepID=UPI001F5A3DAF|nr:hypothetical protein [Aestuariivivens sediminis]